MNTHAGQELATILASQPFHLMNEEDKPNAAGIPNLNHVLRPALAGTKKPFPAHPNWTCDVVFTLAGVRIWMESKYSQTHNGGNRPQWSFKDGNGSFRKHLGLLKSAHSSAIHDVVDRLPTLDRSGVTDRIAFLMVAFDSPRFPIDGAIQKFVQLGGLQAWEHDVVYTQPDPRDKAKLESARIQVLYWERPVIA